MTEYLVYDKNNNSYNVYDVEKIINDNIKPQDKYNIELFCSICDNNIYFRAATSKRKAQLCHFKNTSCYRKNYKNTYYD